jgi:hypothetical protein
MYEKFFVALKHADILCGLAADCNNRAANLLREAESHKDEVRSLKKQSKNAEGSEREASLKKKQSHNEAASQLKTSAELLIKEADANSHNAFLLLFGYKSYDDFRNLLAFLQTLHPKQAAEILKHLIAIVTNQKITEMIQEEAVKVARGKKTLLRLDRWKVMNFVVQNALFCERIKINHRLYFPTNFLRFHVASLQYQGKMAQMRTIAYEPLKTFKRRRLNLLNCSAFLYFLFRKVLTLPARHHFSLEFKRLLQK